MSATGTQEEMIDVLTVAGDFVGSFPRSQVHREGLWHKVIHLWIADKYEIEERHLLPHH
jgi:hypothetical protein